MCCRNYIYYLVHLTNKEPTQYSGVEDYVFEMYQQGDNSWFPNGMALSLEKLDVEDEADKDTTSSGQVDATVQEEVKSSQTKLESRVEEMESKLDTIITMLGDLQAGSNREEGL